MSSEILTKILPGLQLENLDQTLCSKSEQKLSLTKPQLPISQQTGANTIINTSISNSNNFNLEWVSSHARVTSIKFNKRGGVSE